MNQPSPSERWAALKTRGNATLREIDDIDNATPWRPREPAWWCEMMEARRKIVKSIVAANAVSQK